MNMTRRRLLQVGSAATIVTIAGCSSNQAGDANGNGTTTDEPSTTTGTTTANGQAPAEPLPIPTKGDPDAAVLVEAFEDFTCGYCRNFNLEILPQMETEYIESGDVRFRRRDFPFLDEVWSWKAAHAARAVQEKQGDEAFFEYAHLLYQNLDSYSVDRFADLAEQVGVAPEFVRQAVKEERYRETLEAEKSRGVEQNVGDVGTPAVFIDGDLVQSTEFWEYASAIETALSQE